MSYNLDVSRIKKEEWLLVDGKHEPIISEDVFNASLAKFGSMPKVKAASGLSNPFAGILRCSCGRTMIYQPHRRCAARLHCAYQMHCGNRSATYTEVEEEIVKALRKLAADLHELLTGNAEEIPAAHKAIAAKLQKELNALETQQDRLYEFLEQGIYTSEVFVKRNAALAQRRKELNEAIKEAKSMEDSKIDYHQRYIALQEAVKALESPDVSAEEKNRLLRAAVKTITYHRETDIRDKWHNIPFTLDIALL